MQTIVGVRFKKAGKVYYFDPGDIDLKLEDGVIVETVRGLEYGKVVLEKREAEEQETPYRLVVRKATTDDLLQLSENKESEAEAAEIFETQVKKHNLDMNLINVECTFDKSKIIFYFTADGRVDFRALVKDLAAVFRTRIELRQIGVRDEAKQLGGIGACGRPICCAQFLGDFEPVSIKMAKDQNLSLNPTKISGICGRLMCCLKYEQYAYEGVEHKKVEVVEPEQKSRVITADGEGKVISTNKVKRTATILLDDGKTVVLPWEDILEEGETDNTPKTCPQGKNCGCHMTEQNDDIIAKITESAPNVLREPTNKNLARNLNERLNTKYHNERNSQSGENGRNERSERISNVGRTGKEQSVRFVPEKNERIKDIKNERGKFTRDRREHRESREFKRDGRKNRNDIGYGGYGKPAWHDDD